MMAQQEDLGDLKLYRIPERVTVASQSQKQVALLDRKRVKAEIFYRAFIYGTQPEIHGGVTKILKMRNMVAAGLGLPLPAGKIALFSSGSARTMLLGQGYFDDKAVGEEVEIAIGRSVAVSAVAVPLSRSPDGSGEWELRAVNSSPVPVRLEAEIEGRGMKILAPGTDVGRERRPQWNVTVPANGAATLRYRIEKP